VSGLSSHLATSLVVLVGRPEPGTAKVAKVRAVDILSNHRIGLVGFDFVKR